MNLCGLSARPILACVRWNRYGKIPGSNAAVLLCVAEKMILLGPLSMLFKWKRSGRADRQPGLWVASNKLSRMDIPI